MGEKGPAQGLNVIGLVPAAGQASRLGKLPCSKELYPVGFEKGVSGVRPKVACEYLLEAYRQAGIRRAYIVLREGKWDIPAYLGSGRQLDLQLGYLLMDRPHGVPYTLDAATAFVEGHHVALGFPDILFEPKDAFVKLLARHAATDAHVTLGLFPAAEPHKCDMVALDEDGCVARIDIKPPVTELRYSWVIAVWSPAFTRFMHGRLSARPETERELYVGDVIREALEGGCKIESVLFPAGRFIDIGTPEALRATVHTLSQAGE
jgi:glucose-1-phosphate thymidylyltransferase